MLLERIDDRARREDAAELRLIYSKKQEAVALPAGRYRLRHFVIETTYKDEYWAISGTNPKGKQVVIRPGKSSTLEIDPTILFHTASKKELDAVHINFSILGDARVGLSILHNEARVPIEYRLFDGRGTTLASGIMNYG